MREEFNKMNIDGTIVIGEEMDEAPMLFIGEKFGTKNGPKIDIAVDPLEGTILLQKSSQCIFSIMQQLKRKIFFAPDTPMKKLL